MRKLILEYIRKLLRLPKEEVYIWVELYINSIFPESLGYTLPEETKEFVEFMNKYAHEPNCKIILKLKTTAQVFKECFERQKH